MLRYSIEPRARKYVKGYEFLSFTRKFHKQLLNTGLNAVKTASKKEVYKAGEFIESKIADAVTELNDDKIVKPDKNPRNAKEIIISLEKRKEVLNELRQALL